MRAIKLFLLMACLLAGPAALAADSPAIDAAIRDADRSEKDRAADVRRRPRAVLAFFGVDEGMTVLDLYSGGGYYTELVARTVGEDGVVVSHNNQAYLAFAKSDLATRYADDRLPNVERLLAENNEIELDESRFDVVLMVLAYHDVYYVEESIGWPAIDGPALLAEILGSLKPGGVLGVVDHVAVAGAPAEVAQSLHRIDPARLRSDMEAAGFVFDGESDVLRNAADDHTIPMSGPTVRGKTDRVVYRFRRPE